MATQGLRQIGADKIIGIAGYYQPEWDKNPYIEAGTPLLTSWIGKTKKVFIRLDKPVLGSLVDIQEGIVEAYIANGSDEMPSEGYWLRAIAFIEEEIHTHTS